MGVVAFKRLEKSFLRVTFNSILQLFTPPKLPARVEQQLQNGYWNEANVNRLKSGKNTQFSNRRVHKKCDTHRERKKRRRHSCAVDEKERQANRQTNKWAHISRVYIRFSSTHWPKRYFMSFWCMRACGSEYFLRCSLRHLVCLCYFFPLLSNKYTHKHEISIALKADAEAEV